MKKGIFSLLILFLSASSYAQWLSVIEKTAEKATRSSLSATAASTHKWVTGGVRSMMSPISGAHPPLRNVPSYTSLSTQALQRAILVPSFSSVRVPVSTLAHTESFIRQGVVEIIGRATGFLMGSGFVFKSPSGKMYVVAAYHVVGRKGGSVALRFKLPDGSQKVYDNALIVESGAFGVNEPDAVLIELPSGAEQHVKPLPLAKELPSIGEKMTVWGHSYEIPGVFRKGDLIVESAADFKLVMKSEGEFGEEMNGFCGSPILNSKGEVAGIYAGHDFYLQFQVGVSAHKTLSMLTDCLERNIPLKRNWVLNGKTVLVTEGGESVKKIRWIRNGKAILERNLHFYMDEFDSQHLEKLFDLRSGDALSFEVAKGRAVVRTEEYAIP